MTPDDLTRTSPPDATRDLSDAALDAGLAAAFGGDTTHLRPAPADPEGGTVIAGKYRLTERIGEGGMGSVWVAHQSEPVKRKVAVKLIKAGMDSKAVLARFDAERQALAVMDHPNIAKVLDGGVHDGRPYFVMELVKGVPITQFCDERKLTPAQRLELFVPVCQAIQHAHQKGVIHRDIKPSNVLVALYDDKPVPKVIDFGVAKATGAALTEHTLETGFGAVVGTPAYMSPEQASLNNLDIDTRSDVYSLGVLLYELLTGSPPFSKKELDKKGLLEILRVVREEEPPRPSHKLSTADALPTLSANRGTEPKALTGLLRNELDWIVMKALEKDRGRRYETANGFAADVLRYLSGEPVMAHPPSTAYRLKKFVRRNRVQVVAGVLVVLALLGGMAGTSVGLVVANERRKEADQARQNEAEQRIEADRKRAEADRERLRAEAAEDQTLADYRASTDDAIEQLIGSKAVLGPRERAYLENTLKRWQTYANRQGDDAHSRATRAEGHYRVARLWQRLGEQATARRAYEAARAIQLDLVVTHPYEPVFAHALADTLYRLATLLRETGEWDRAKREFLAARDLWKPLADAHPTAIGFRADLANTHNALGLLHRDLGAREEARHEYQAALVIQNQLAADNPDQPFLWHSLALTHNNLGMLLDHSATRADAKREYETARDIKKKLCADHPTNPVYQEDLANTLSNLCGHLFETKDLDGAKREGQAAVDIQKKLSDTYPAVPEYQLHLASYLGNLGAVLHKQGDKAGAKRETAAARGILKKLIDTYPNMPEYRRKLAGNHNNLGELFRHDREWEAAAQEYKAAQVILKELADAYPKVSDYQQDLALFRTNLGELFQARGEREDAIREFQAALTLRKGLVAAHPRLPEYQHLLASSHLSLGDLLLEMGERGEAAREFATARDVAKKLVDEYPGVADYLMRLGLSHLQLATIAERKGDRAAERREREAATAVWGKLVENHPRDVGNLKILAGLHKELAALVEKTGDQAAGRREREAAREVLKKLIAIEPNTPRHRKELAECHNRLGLLLGALGERDSGEREFEAAREVLKKLITDHPDVPEHQINLGGNYCNHGLLLRDAARPVDSLKWFDTAIETLAAVHTKDPRNALAKQYLVNTHGNRAVARGQVGQFAEAVADWDRVIELSPKQDHPRIRVFRVAARAKTEQLAEAVAEVDELAKSPLWSAAQWYDFACVYAVASGKLADKKTEYADAAMELLAKAVKAGYKDAAHMKADTDLDSLRERDDFNKLVADLEAKFPPKKENLPPPRVDK